VDLGATNAGDADLRALKELKRLKVLYLGYGTRITDVGLAHLKPLVTLEELYLPETRVTDAGLVHLRSLKSLRKLGLLNCKGVTDAGMVHLRGLRNLTDLSLSGTQVTQPAVAELQKLLSNAYISGGLRVLPKDSPSRAERKRKLKLQTGRGVREEMLDFLSFLDGTEAGSGAAVKKHVVQDRNSFDFRGVRFENPRVLKIENKDGQVCYTTEFRQGIGRGTYLICWNDGKIRSIRQVSLVFE
jgi:hypothetical protein